MKKKQIISVFNRAGDTDTDFVSIVRHLEDGSCWADMNEDYVRLTEPLEVEFVMLPAESVLEKQLAAIDAKEQDLRAKFSMALRELEQRRAELAALPSP